MSISIYFGENKDAGIYQDGQILSCDAETSVTVIGDTISIDQFHAEVIGSPIGYVQLTTVSDEVVYDANDSEINTVYGNGVSVNEIAYGTPIWFYVDNTMYGKYYFSSVDRISEKNYRITAVSAMGLLDTIYCNGGIYYDDTFTEVIADIIGNTIPYTVDEQLSAIPVRGWIPVSTKKDALHQLMLAVGCDLKKDANGNMVFYFNNGNTSKTIPDSRIYLDGTMVNNSQATEVDVTEHSFINDASDATITIYDNTNSDEVVNARIDFSSAPVHDLVATGTITITESNCNYAIISGKGKLTGKKYTHTTRLTRAVDLAATGSTNIATVDAGTLISDLNSGNVAQRLLAYYKFASTINADIIVDGEKSGDKVELTNPFGELSSAYIKSMDIIGDKVVSAKCEMITGYTPCFQGNTYHESIVLTGSGTYTVPDGKYYLTAILIGGGQGGQGGGRGADGVDGSDYTNVAEEYCMNSGTPGNGGAAGSGGNGGKIYQKVISVVPGDVISYSCGAGGAGGSGNSGTGAIGGATTFGDYSSDNGAVASSGVVDRYTGITYGRKGENGLSGANGGKGQYNYWYDPGNGGSVGEYRGGYACAVKKAYSVEKGGNGGGGAAMGANGGDATQCDNWGSGGRAGNGASATIPGTAASVYGVGGQGGNGGGGGGANGYVESDYSIYQHQSSGTGGNGSSGGAGAQGCVIIYV